LESKAKSTRASMSMKEAGFKSKLDQTLTKLELSRNALAVESKVRPLTINSIYSEDAKQLNFHTLKQIIEALDRLAAEKNINKKHSISDIVDVAEVE
jgi:DNA-binding Xre family transcriptional regulator